LVTRSGGKSSRTCAPSPRPTPTARFVAWPLPRLRTWALQQVGSYLGYAGHQIDVVVTAARDPKPALLSVIHIKLKV
jgi:hypothetical protein